MKNFHIISSSNWRLKRAMRTQRKDARGVALVTTLILLALLGALSVALSLLVSSDTMINGYYRNYRGSFYAADSGANIVVESMKNVIYNAADGSAVYPNAPLPTDGLGVPLHSGDTQTMNAADGDGATKAFPPNFSNSFSPFSGQSYTIGDSGSWQGKFKLVSVSFGNPTFTASSYSLDSASCWPPTTTSPAPNCPNGVQNDSDVQWVFRYPYTVVVQGQSSGSEVEQITETGVIVYQSAPGGASDGGTLFSKWGAYITKYDACQGPLVPGTMSGPFFTDGQWNFGNFTSPTYTFTGSVGQVGSKVSWWNNNSCTNSTTPPRGFKAPTFQQGFQTGQPLIQPPTDTYNQAQAVLDGKGNGTSCDSTCQTQMMSQELKTITGTAYPASGTPANGVYIPMYTDPTTHNPTFGCQPPTPPTTSTCTGAAGGFYVQGNASIKLSATTTGSDPTQTYTITQGSTTTTIVVDNTLNTTTVTQNGNAPVTLTGVPSQVGASSTQDPSGNTVDPTMVYVNGSITGLTGPTDARGNPQPAIQNDVGVTVVSPTGVTISGDLEYAQSPVSGSDVLNASTDAGVLGIYTTGDINLKPDAKGNLTVDASLAALSGKTDGTGTSGFNTPSGNIGTWNILGGRAEDEAHSVNISSGNTLYDQRFSSGNFGPPWFPTSVPQIGTPPVSAYSQVQVQRGAWSESSRN